ncbi:glycosyltransferase family 2 protein [Candidatus Methylopumilus universalis]|uniref:glycosyltransferase family 2 protein n=1 Tax=Candidatus Methylopumilus universalis TaxID=2588536 RepID=UPI00111CFB37|nr:glycosyltransferase [Candidatus Methylopumilus universalis]QDC88112.1 glycosyltransferase [Candidatus Methylopumilus universalis]
MTRNPLVTVVIPSYNHQTYVAQSIQSVFSQTYKEVELIVIDDGSSDASAKVIQKLMHGDKFKFIARKNRGLATTLNEGIKLAKGQYICFLASDDYFMPKRVEHAVSRLKGSDDDLIAVYTDGLVMDSKNKKLSKFSDIYPRPFVGDVYSNLIVSNWIPAMGITYKTNLLKKFMFEEHFKIEDHVLYLKIFKGNKFKIIFYKGYDFCYRQHGGNMSNISKVMTYENKLIKNNFTDVKRHAEFLESIKKRSFSKIFNMNRYDLYLLSLKFLRFWVARIYLIKLKIVRCLSSFNIITSLK